ncbi:MAG: GNAT family N-acetyltransferase [Verrucomicrobiota bacterium]
MIINWLRFTWDLEKIPTAEPSVPTPFTLRVTEGDEEAAVQKTVASAFSMDTGWGDIQKFLIERMTKSIGLAFEKDSKSRCLVLLHGTRIIGASVLCTDPDADNHLTTGPCILHEYGSRGLGSLLLSASLSALRADGLKRAYGITREKTASARFIYPKSGGGAAAPWTLDLEAPAKPAA